MKCRDLIRSMLCFCLLFWAQGAQAQDRNLRLEAPEALWSSGLLKHMLPRFSLKTSIRFDPVEAEGDVVFAIEGDGHRALLLDGALYTVSLAPGADARASRFLDWLKSEVGVRTMLAFNKDGRPEVALPGKVEVKAVEVSADGDAVLGERLALVALWALSCGFQEEPDGGDRVDAVVWCVAHVEQLAWPLDAFFALNPHPSFTQIEEVTEPFDPMRPPMIAPIELTLDEVAAITAFAATIGETDLGGALVSK